VRFDLHAIELDSFMESTLCTAPLQPVDPEKYKSETKELEWFQPDKSTDLMECYGEKNASHQTIIVDRTNPKVYRIYVTCSVFN